MGTWGTGLSSNDTFADIYSEFMDMYDNGLIVSEITQKLIDTNTDYINDSEDSHDFWFAIAKAQWECKSLEYKISEKVKSIIESEADLKHWKESGASDSDVSKRKKVLEKFLIQISTEREKARKPKKKVIRRPIFEKGDCLTFRLANENYGAVLVLEAEKETDLGMNMLAITELNQHEKPTIKEIEKSNILVRREEMLNGYREREAIIWCYSQFYKKSKTQFEKIGDLKVSRSYNSKEHCYWVGQWDSIPSVLNNLNVYEDKHGKPKHKVKLAKWRKRHWL